MSSNRSHRPAAPGTPTPRPGSQNCLRLIQQALEGVQQNGERPSLNLPTCAEPPNHSPVFNPGSTQLSHDTGPVRTDTPSPGSQNRLHAIQVALAGMANSPDRNAPPGSSRNPVVVSPSTPLRPPTGTRLNPFFITPTPRPLAVVQRPNDRNVTPGSSRNPIVISPRTPLQPPTGTRLNPFVITPTPRPLAVVQRPNADPFVAIPAPGPRDFQSLAVQTDASSTDGANHQSIGVQTDEVFILSRLSTPLPFPEAISSSPSSPSDSTPSSVSEVRNGQKRPAEDDGDSSPSPSRRQRTEQWHTPPSHPRTPSPDARSSNYHADHSDFTIGSSPQLTSSPAVGNATGIASPNPGSVGPTPVAISSPTCVNTSPPARAVAVILDSSDEEYAQWPDYPSSDSDFETPGFASPSALQDLVVGPAQAHAKSSALRQN